MSRLALCAVPALLIACGALSGDRAHPTPDDLALPPSQIDLSGIERNGPKTDVVADYWSTSFASLGQEDTFRLFARKYDLLAKEDPGEAESALKGFRRLCRLRGSLSAFEEFWASRQQ